MTEGTQNKRLLAARILLTVCTAGIILFIFSNSMEVAQVSSGRSGAITGRFNAILGQLQLELCFTEHLIRKLAHVAEYMLLGFFLLLTLRAHTKRIIVHLSYPLFIGLLVPVLDEAIQLLTDGRSAEVRDVLIDFSGVLGGIACALLLLLLLRAVGRWRSSAERLQK